MLLIPGQYFITTFETKWRRWSCRRCVPYLHPDDEHHIEIELTKENEAMLWTILVILLILWLLGFSFHLGGGLIHILLVIAVIVLVINLVSGRRG